MQPLKAVAPNVESDGHIWTPESFQIRAEGGAGSALLVARILQKPQLDTLHVRKLLVARIRDSGALPTHLLRHRMMLITANAGQ